MRGYFSGRGSVWKDQPDGSFMCVLRAQFLDERAHSDSKSAVRSNEHQYNHFAPSFLERVRGEPPGSRLAGAAAIVPASTRTSIPGQSPAKANGQPVQCVSCCAKNARRKFARPDFTTAASACLFRWALFSRIFVFDFPPTDKIRPTRQYANDQQVF